MYVIEARNVNDAYSKGFDFFRNAHFPIFTSRGGAVMEAPYPVTTEYEFPQERVLFSAKRDANPFFHLFEALWMLVGRRDVEFLRQFSEQAANLIEGQSSYGYRWRSHFGVDQLYKLIRLLREDPTTRRAVIAMWDPATDLGSNLKDIPCNDTIQFSLRRNGYLDMQVFCRSNDMIWGAYGANAVHMSMLQEYVASMLGARMGYYWQISCNFHAYVDVFNAKTSMVPEIDPYRVEMICPQPLVNDPLTFDDDLNSFLINKEDSSGRNHFISHTAEPMWTAWRSWKAGYKKEALEVIDSVLATDWHLACRRWFERRL